MSTVSCLGLLLGLYLVATVARLRDPPPLVPLKAQANEGGVAVEHVGRGLACPRASPLPPFSRCCGERPCGRMSATRRRLVGAPIELARADRAELEDLPGIGPRLAARILAARDAPQGLDLRRIRGLGARRTRELAHRLGLDGSGPHDICSWGSWPTTSSGCGKPP